MSIQLSYMCKMDVDTTSFELGMPTRIEMLEHQCEMLIGENDQLREDLGQARTNIAKLVEINTSIQEQLIAESKRANLAHVKIVQIQNRLRCSHGIDASTWFDT